MVQIAEKDPLEGCLIPQARQGDTLGSQGVMTMKERAFLREILEVNASGLAD